MKFPYIKFPSTDPQRKWISRPLIPIKLIGPKNNWEGYALVDSGADRSLFNIAIAEKTGMDFEKDLTEDFSGIEGGTLRTNLSKVKLQIIGTEETVEVIAGFVDSPNVSAILGQDGFFDVFRIKFERDHGLFEIIPVSK